MPEDISTPLRPIYWATQTGIIFRPWPLDYALCESRRDDIIYTSYVASARSLGRPKNRWEDDVKSDITRMKITNWKDCIRNRTKWKKLA
jgi:hypothetical protein